MLRLGALNGRLITASMNRVHHHSILGLLRQCQVKNHADKSSNDKARLHDNLDSIHEAAEAGVGSMIGKDVVKVSGDQGGAVADSKTGSEDESVPPRERHTAGDNSHTRDGDGAEEEGSHAAEDG